MQFDLTYAKSHWKLIGGSFVGFLVLYYIIKHFGSSGAASSANLSGGDAQLAAINAAADQVNSAANAQITVASIQGQVASVQSNNALAATLAKIEADKSVANTQTAGEVAVGLHGQDTAVTTAQILGDAAVAQTQVQANAIVELGAQKEAVAAQQVKNVNSQIMNLMTYSKHFGSDIKSIAPALLAETGQGGSAVGVAQANAQESIAKSPANTITAISSGLSSVIAGLFA